MIRSQSYCLLGIISIYFFFCLLPLPSTTFASPTRFLCRDDQRDALLEFKKFSIHTDVLDSSGRTTSWNKSVDCCSWQGVTCDAILGEVISLDLACSFANISLKPSSGLFKLQHLTYLDLSLCRLQGEIPSSIGNLSHLTFLDLSSNDLVGEVPALIGNLNQLESMILSDNDLRGNIPTSFANFTRFSVLKLDGNQFTGGDRVIANLTTLSEIDLSNNHFTSLITAYLSGLHNLERFSGYNNSFFGPFPSSLFMIPSLSYIDLGQNQFEGPIDFRNTSSSSNLKELRVGYNNLDGLIPESISKFANLYSLDLSHNSFGGRVPSSIGQLRNLQYLYLSQNNFSGRIPSSISKLANLSNLDLSHNNFGGRVPRSISKLVNLRYLDLSYNKLEGQVQIPQIPHSKWRSSAYLIGFNVDNNFVDLSHNAFSSFEKPVELGKETLSSELDLSSNSLQGPIPQWICNFRKMKFLDLSNNHINGSVPKCLKNSEWLHTLNLRNNSLSGFLPDLCIDSSTLQIFAQLHDNGISECGRKQDQRHVSILVGLSVKLKYSCAPIKCVIWSNLQPLCLFWVSKPEDH